MREGCTSVVHCNQAAGLSRCLSKLQQGMQSLLKVLQAEQTKGKLIIWALPQKSYSTCNSNSSITQCMAKAMEHLSDFVFVSMANVTLGRRDSYLALVKCGLKQDTLAALHQAPLDLQPSSQILY